MPYQEDPTNIEETLIPDFESNKIEIFNSINDLPIAPTNTNGSNVSHLHDEHNKLIDIIINGHTELRKAIQYNFNTITSNSNLTSNNAALINDLNNTIDSVNTTINTINSRLYDIEQQLSEGSSGGGSSSTSTFDYNFNLVYDSNNDDSTALISTIELSGRLNQITLSNLPASPSDVSFLIGNFYLAISNIEPVNPSTFNFIISENIASDVTFGDELKIQIIDDHSSSPTISATVYITSEGQSR